MIGLVNYRYILVIQRCEKSTRKKALLNYGFFDSLPILEKRSLRELEIE